MWFLWLSVWTSLAIYFQQSVHKINYHSREYSTRHIGTKALTDAYNCGIFLMSDRCSGWRDILISFSFNRLIHKTVPCLCNQTSGLRKKNPGSTFLFKLFFFSVVAEQQQDCLNFKSLKWLCYTYSWMNNSAPSHCLNLIGRKGEGPHGAGCVSKGEGEG